MATIVCRSGRKLLNALSHAPSSVRRLRRSLHLRFFVEEGARRPSIFAGA
jgi:hypothetical protein